MIERVLERVRDGKRSPLWPATKRKHYTDPANRKCLACKGTVLLRVHHVVPVSVDPMLELEPWNLVTLCDAPWRRCHFIFGHLHHWGRYDSEVVEKAEAFAWARLEAEIDRNNRRMERQQEKP